MNVQYVEITARRCYRDTQQVGAVSNNTSSGAGSPDWGSLTGVPIASASVQGIASFNSTNFAVVSGVVNTIQNIHSGASPTFAGLSLNGTLNIGSSGVLQIGGTIVIDASRNLTNIGTISSGLVNAQTISSAANFTGTMYIAGDVGIGRTSVTSLGGNRRTLDIRGGSDGSGFSFGSTTTQYGRFFTDSNMILYFEGNLSLAHRPLINSNNGMIYITAASTTIYSPSGVAGGGTLIVGTVQVTGLTASRFVQTDGSKNLASFDLFGTANTWNATQAIASITLTTALAVASGGTGVTALSDVLGTTNQITVTGGTARVIGGNVTLSLPQNIHSAASPTFAGMNLSGLTTSRFVQTDGSKYLISFDLFGTANTFTAIQSAGTWNATTAFTVGGITIIDINRNILNAGNAIFTGSEFISGNLAVGASSTYGYRLYVNGPVLIDGSVMVTSTGPSTFGGMVSAPSFTDGYNVFTLAQINRSGGIVELQYNGDVSGHIRMFGGTSAPITFYNGSGKASFAGTLISGIGTSTATPHVFYASDYYNGAGHASFVGNWASSGTWGLGTNTASADNTLKLASSSSDGTWNGGYAHLLVYGNVTGLNLFPLATDAYDIGSSLLWWRSQYVSQINATVFAEQTQTLLGGWFTVGKDQGVLPAVTANQTQIDFKKAMTVGHFIVVKAHDASGTIKTEYIQIGSLVSGTTYNATRDLAGAHSTDPVWADGTPYLLLGTTESGRIELNAFDTPRISILKQGAAYNVQTEVLRIGDINGLAGVEGETYGFFVGSASRYLCYNSVVDTLTVTGTINASAGAFSNTVYVGATSTRILIDGTNKILKSENYSAGNSGWAIKGDGTAEFSSAVVRGTIQASAGAIGGWGISNQYIYYGYGGTGYNGNDTSQMYLYSSRSDSYAGDTAGPSINLDYYSDDSGTSSSIDIGVSGYRPGYGFSIYDDNVGMLFQTYVYAGNSVAQIAGWSFNNVQFWSANGKVNLISNQASVMVDTGIGTAGITRYINLGQTFDGNSWTGHYGISIIRNGPSELMRVDDSVARIAGWSFSPTTFINQTGVYTGGDRFTINLSNSTYGSDGALNYTDANYGALRGMNLVSYDAVHTHGWRITIGQMSDQVWYMATSSKTGYYGIEMVTGHVSGAWTREQVFRLSASQTSGTLDCSIAGWNFDNAYLWTGTKQTSDTYSSSGITIASAGSIRSPQFYIGTNGNAYFKGAVSGATISGGSISVGGFSVSSGQSQLALFTAPSMILSVEESDNGELTTLNGYEIAAGYRSSDYGQSTTSMFWKVGQVGPVYQYGIGFSDCNHAIDTILYRSAVAVLTTNSVLIMSVAGGNKNELQIASTTAGTGITVGGDTNLYRLSANTWQTDDNFSAAGWIAVTGVLNTAAGVQISSTTVIDSSRNLTNIGTISAGGTVTATGAVIVQSSANPYYRLTDNASVTHYLEIVSSNLQITVNGGSALSFDKTTRNASFASNGIFGGDYVRCSGTYGFVLGELSGVARFRWNGSASEFQLFTSSNAYANARAASWINNSDARLKTNIQPVQSAMVALKTLQGVFFRWIDGDAGRHLGFLAQNVEAVLPGAVTSDDRGYKGVAYNEVIPLLVEGVKETYDEVSLLRARVAELETEVAIMKAAQ